MRNMTQLELQSWYTKWRPDEKLQLALDLKIVKIEDGKFVKQNSVPRSIDEMSNQNRALVHARDKECAYCGADGELTVDHFIPASAWPEHLLWLANTSSNLVSACWDCNKAKSVKVPDEQPYKRIWPIVKSCNECSPHVHGYCDDCEPVTAWCGRCQQSSVAALCQLPMIECEGDE